MNAWERQKRARMVFDALTDTKRCPDCNRVVSEDAHCSILWEMIGCTECWVAQRKAERAAMVRTERRAATGAVLSILGVYAVSLFGLWLFGGLG